MDAKAPNPAVESDALQSALLRRASYSAPHCERLGITMNRPCVALITVLAALVVNVASAQERVVITYTAGYPFPDRSSSAAQVEIVRYAAPLKQQEVEVDRFFGDVRKILSEYRVSSKWTFVQPDSAYVRMAIHLSEGDWELASSLPPAPGAETLSINKMDTQLRHQVAFEKVRRLAHEYLQQRIQR